MPGVTVTTALRSGPAAANVPPSATAFFPTVSEVGPLWTPTAIRSVAEFEATFGPNNTAVAGELGDYFDQGGALAWVVNGHGTDAVLPTLTLTDASDADTLRVDGVAPHDLPILITVAAGTNANTYKLTIDATSVEAGAVYVIDNIATAADAPAAVAASGASRYVTVTDLPASSLDPEPLAATALVDGDADAATMIAEFLARNPFPEDLGAGAVVFAGAGLNSLNAADVNLVIDYITQAQAGRRLLVVSALAGVDFAAGTAATAATDLADAIAAEVDIAPSTANTEALLSSVVAVGPFLTSTAGGFRLGVGAWAGLRARAHTVTGPHGAAAGAGAILIGDQAATVVYGGSTPATLTPAEVLVCDVAGIVPFRTMVDRSGVATVRPYGVRSLAAAVAASAQSGDGSADWPTISARDVLNVAAAEADRRAEPLTFRGIDARGHIFADLGAILAGIGSELRDAGALYPSTTPDGIEVDPGYAVDVSAAVNTSDTIAAGEVNGVLAIRPTPTGSLVNVTVTKVAAGAAI